MLYRHILLIEFHPKLKKKRAKADKFIMIFYMKFQINWSQVIHDMSPQMIPLLVHCTRQTVVAPVDLALELARFLEIDGRLFGSVIRVEPGASHERAPRHGPFLVGLLPLLATLDVRKQFEQVEEQHGQVEQGHEDHGDDGRSVADAFGRLVLLRDLGQFLCSRVLD